MRHVVYLLLVLNLVFLGWNIFQSQSAMQAERNFPPIPESAAPLVTLQEQQAADADRTTDLMVSLAVAVSAKAPPAVLVESCR